MPGTELPSIGELPFGNRVALVGTPEPRLGRQ
jgi:hypothetical protein